MTYENIVRMEGLRYFCGALVWYSNRNAKVITAIGITGLISINYDSWYVWCFLLTGQL